MLTDKKTLRKELKTRRRNMDENNRFVSDGLIYNNLISCPEIAEAETILTYISTEIEVDTIRFIETMLECGKTVAVPKCEGKNMRFIRITGFNCLEKGAFGIFEPTGTDEITDFSNSVCITPALSFNREGYRLGYGGGFYDRFSEHYSGISVGICYEEFLGEIPTEEFDRPVKILITENEIRYIQK